MLCVMKHTARRLATEPTPMTLLALRRRAGFTQVEFAPLAGLERPRLSKIETHGSPRVPFATVAVVTAHLRKNNLLFDSEVVSFAAPTEPIDTPTEPTDATV